MSMTSVRGARRPGIHRGALLVVALASLLALVACSDDSGSDSGAGTEATTTAEASTGTAASTATAEATASPESRDIAHELGTTTITGIPERIVVLEYSFADNLGSLEVAPVGYAVDAPPDYLATYTADVGAVAVGTRAEPDLEAIAALNPDLIIGDLQRHEETYPLLSEIAPTLIFNSLRGSYQDQLDTFAVIADILGKQDEAAALLATYESSFDAAAEQANAEAAPILVGVLHPGGFTAHTSQSFMGSLLDSLGRPNVLEPVDGETQYDFSLEGIVGADPSGIVVLCAPGEQELLDTLSSEPAWQVLDAVTNERVYVFDRNLWSKGRGLIAYEQILADAVDSGLLSDGPSTRTSCG